MMSKDSTSHFKHILFNNNYCYLELGTVFEISGKLFLDASYTNIIDSQE